MSELAQEYYDNLTNQAGPIAVALWEAEVTDAEARRFDDRPAMDIYASKLERPVVEIPPQLEANGSALDKWMAFALSVENQQ